MAAPRAAWRNRGTTYNGKCGGVRQSAQGEIGTYTTLAPRDEPKRWQLGNAAAFGSRRRVGIGTYTTLAPLDEPKRWQLGPTILFDRPRPAPHSPCIRFPPWGRCDAIERKAK